MFKKTTLPNGFRIITAPMNGTNTVTILVLCGTGSDYEARENNGISHFLEHMFFKGTKRRPDTATVTQELDGMGTMYNAFTSHETTGYYIKAGKTYLDQSLDVLADIYKHSLLKAEEIDKEKQVIVEELHRILDTPTRNIWDRWEELLYGDQPAGWEIIGKEETIRGFTREDFVEYFTHQYVASNTAVVVAGNFDEARTIERVSELFADIRHDDPIRKKPDVTDQQASPIAHVTKKDSDQTQVTLGFRGFSAKDPNRYAAGVLAAILGAGMSSRMFSRVRAQLGLAYTVMTEHETYSNRGYLVTYAGVDHTNAERAIRAILEEYTKIRDAAVPAEELKRVKDYIRGTTLIGLEASNAVASFVGSEEMMTGSPLTVEEVFTKIDAITPEDIQKVAAAMMRPEKLNLAMIGPFDDSVQFQKILEKFK